MFDPRSCTGRLRSCPFLRGRHALRIGWARVDAAMVVAEAGAILVHGGVEHPFQERASDSYVLCSFAVSHTGSRPNTMTRGYLSCGDKWMPGNAMERGG